MIFAIVQIASLKAVIRKASPYSSFAPQIFFLPYESRFPQAGRASQAENDFLRYKCKKTPRKRGIDGKISSHGVMKVHSITDALILPRKARTCQ